MTFGALSEDEFVGMTAKNLTHKEFKTFTQRLYYKYKKIVFIVDNASWHHATAIGEYIKNRDIVFIFLPAYSPELNPVEQVWKKLKSILATKIWNSLEELKNHIIAAFRQKQLLVKFYDYLRV